MAAAAQPVLKPTAAEAVTAPAADSSLAPTPAFADRPPIDQWVRVGPLPCLLTVEIPVPGFTVGDLVRLERGRIIATHWTVGQDVPLRVNGELIAWSEFEVLQSFLAVRLTELA
jgi:flagellar motor switch/type III secretory pathway protein FliN